ncbi:DUF397 domain-containing protein [Streptomyces johnsoniae]|uniref:DUF397 domain-containing protein n=1 Tax=Streptomyces johnsoniae TaxID=3075532 RepID=A0ABU2S5E1_9ACTN|nr:DUF397 domain-containing protein [Streptomyces sp. DSM 41886]MDT0444206.1 DUF397 domain-containing protein [Streptomyces sp. DSM 41886]
MFATGVHGQAVGARAGPAGPEPRSEEFEAFGPQIARAGRAVPGDDLGFVPDASELSATAAAALHRAAWFTSSYSNDQGGNCVQGARLGGEAMAVRDSKDTSGPTFIFSRAAWSAFLDAAGSGALDQPTRG